MALARQMARTVAASQTLQPFFVAAGYSLPDANN